MKIAIVEWVDSCSVSGWKSSDTLDEANISRCVSVGMYKEYDDHVNVVQNRSEHSVGDILSIPKIAITRTRYLKCI